MFLDKLRSFSACFQSRGSHRKLDVSLLEVNKIFLVALRHIIVKHTCPKVNNSIIRRLLKWPQNSFYSASLQSEATPLL